MSAVSPESPRTSADLAVPADERSSAPAAGEARADGRSSPAARTANTGNNAASAASADAGPHTNFGPNEWLVDELYQRYQEDPGSVDRAWWNFFADYRPAPSDQPVLPVQSAPVQSAPPV